MRDEPDNVVELVVERPEVRPVVEHFELVVERPDARPLTERHFELEPAEEPFERETHPVLKILDRDHFEGDIVPEHIVEKAVYRGLTHQLVGASKDGKTYLALQILIAVSTGQPLLGLPTVRNKVYVVSLEMTAAMVRDRIREICDDVGLPEPEYGRDYVVSAPLAGAPLSLRLQDQGYRDALEDAIRESGAAVVLLDTVQSATPGTDHISGAELGPLYEFFVDLARRTGIALVLIDHTRKGDVGEAVSQAAVGSQIKGARCAVTMYLRRIDRKGPGSWELSFASHLPAPDEVITYKRPDRPDGRPGAGCVPCSKVEARGADFATVEALFREHGERDDLGRPCFASQNALKAAAQAAGLVPAGSSSLADDMVHAIRSEHCAPEDAVDTDWKESRPVWTREGKRRSLVFTWRLGSGE